MFHSLQEKASPLQWYFMEGFSAEWVYNCQTFKHSSHVWPVAVPRLHSGENLVYSVRYTSHWIRQVDDFLAGFKLGAQMLSAVSPFFCFYCFVLIFNIVLIVTNYVIIKQHLTALLAGLKWTHQSLWCRKPTKFLVSNFLTQTTTN